jgi:hypothetical protein
VLTLTSLQLTERTADMQVLYNDGGDGRLTAILFSLSGRPILPGAGSILDITFRQLHQSTEVTEVSVEELILADLTGRAVLPIMTGVEAAVGASIPTAYALAQNYPNPFNARTVIRYELPETGHVIVEIRSLSGQMIRRVVDAPHPAGRYTVVWDGLDRDGRPVGSGLYLYRLQAGRFVDVKKMLLMK